MAQWKPIQGISPPVSIHQFTGYNGTDIFSLPETASTSEKNLTSSAFPALTVRSGQTSLGTALGGLVTGLGVWKDSEIHAIANGAWQKWNGSAWSSLTTGLSTTGRCSFTNFQGNYTAINLFMANGVDGLKRYDGTAIQSVTTPAVFSCIAQHDNRLYGANGYTVYYSALRKADDWTTANDAGQIVVETPSGENITGIVPGPGHLIVFKTHSMFELYGNGPSSYKLTEVSQQIGCVNGNTAVMIGRLLIFLGVDGIYSYYGGFPPTKDFSMSVKKYIDNMNVANRSKAFALTDGTRYYLAIPTGTNVEPDTILEYDTIYQTWHVWNLGANTPAMARMKDQTYIGTDTGIVNQLTGSTDNGTSISWEWISRPFGEQFLNAKHRWYRLWVTADIPVGSSINIYLSNQESGNNWSLVKTVMGQSGQQTQQIMLPIGSFANSNWIRIRLFGSGNATIREITRQVRLIPFAQG